MEGWIMLGVLVAILVYAGIYAYYATFVEPKRRAEKRELYRKQRSETIQKLVAMNPKFVVVFRAESRRQTDFETRLIGELVDRKIEVRHLPMSFSDKLYNGELDLLHEGELLITGFYKTAGESSCADVRVVNKDEKILASVVYGAKTEDELAVEIVHYLAQVLPQQPAAARAVPA